MLFTIIAYRADGIDTCRGCEMGWSSSNFEISYADEVDAAALEMAKYIVFDHFSDREYCSTDVTLLIDGSDGQQYEHEFNDSEEQIYNLIVNKSREMAAAEIADIIQIKAEKEQKRILEENERARMRDMAEFERLKARLGLTDKQD